MALQAPNTTVKLEVERNGQTATLDVTVGERKNQNQSSQYIPLPKTINFSADKKTSLMMRLVFL